MIEQIEIIKNKLEEYKLDHKTHESSIEDDIGAKYLFFSLLLFPQNERKYTKVGFRGNNSSMLWMLAPPGYIFVCKKMPNLVDG